MSHGSREGGRMQTAAGARFVSGKDRMNRAERTPLHVVIAGPDPAIHGDRRLQRDLPMNVLEPDVSMDHRVIGERSDTVLQRLCPVVRAKKTAPRAATSPLQGE